MISLREALAILALIYVAAVCIEAGRDPVTVIEESL